MNSMNKSVSSNTGGAAESAWTGAAAAARAWAGPAEADEAARVAKEQVGAAVEAAVEEAVERREFMEGSGSASSSPPLYKPHNDAVMNMERQSRLFDIYMMVYKGVAYDSKEHEGWVRDWLRLKPELCRTTLIYHHEDESWRRPDDNRFGAWIYGMDDKFRANLMYPIPVYWGGARDDLFSWRAVKGLGYGPSETTKIPEEIRDTVRYAIVGAVKVKAYGALPERDAYVIHTEGVNLESTETAAFKSIVGRRSGSGSIVFMRSKDEILNMYYTRHRAVLKLIIEAAMSQTEQGEHAFIQAPMIGAGCFLHGLEGTGLQAEDFLIQQFNALISVLNTAPQEYNFTYKLCIFNTEHFSNNIIEKYTNSSFIHKRVGAQHDKPRFILGTNKLGGNVLADVPYGVPGQKVFVVNPGDLRSCIGNGMRHDTSVEGFIVANAQNYNPQWQNTSFLHNPYFNPDIFNPVEAAAEGRQVWKPTSKW